MREYHSEMKHSKQRADRITGNPGISKKTSKTPTFFLLWGGENPAWFIRVFYDKLKCSWEWLLFLEHGKASSPQKVIQRRGGRGENRWRILWSKQEFTADRAQTPKDLRKKWGFIEILKKEHKRKHWSRENVTIWGNYRLNYSNF